MARRKASWQAHEFVGESPVTIEKPPEVKTVNHMVKELDDQFLSNEIDENEYISKLNKMYINCYYVKTDRPDVDPMSKLKMYYGYLIVHGEPAKKERRKQILFNL